MYEECTRQELEAYRELDGVPFDFGSGMIYPSNTMGSEDAYLSMAINEHAEDYWYKKYQSNMKALNCTEGRHYEDCHSCCSNECVFAGFLTTKKRPSIYNRNRHHKNKLYRYINDIIPYDECFWSNGYRRRTCGYSDYYPVFVYYDDKGDHYIARIYKSGRIKWLKAYSNRKVRNTMHQYGKGHNYKKEFDLWWQYD